MKVELIINKDIKENKVIIEAKELTQEIQELINAMETKENVVYAYDKNEKIKILKPEEIYMICTEGGKGIIYCENESYVTKKRLYEIAANLGSEFFQISKSSYVSLKYLDSVEPYFNGTMLLKLKNGKSDYISRSYLPKFKKYLGL